ncbi:DedA family protein [Galactobacter caseinivorans]|uniref:DedA family protein n=1 Tax=Galactobacter caseinivorans TaxID=2676123 RepID=A0A496PJD2_9MICC|nr:DedA family protein [Galactobacter caseinivorans]RKW70595.1 DedA family protein [Galactobacter caseinivorans]
MSLHQINQIINDWVLGASTAWWVLPIIFLFCVIDGFFPVLPSESLIVALAAVWVGWDAWHVVALALVGAAGALIGDQIAYRIGRSVGTSRFKWMYRPRIRKVFDMAEHQLEQRGAVLIFTARYIPVGRVAVNFTAGATRYSQRSFTFFDTLGCILWGFYSVAIGALAGRWMEHNKLLAIVISVAIAIVLGWVLDQLIHRLLLRFRPHSSVLDTQAQALVQSQAQKEHHKGASPDAEGSRQRPGADPAL